LAKNRWIAAVLNLFLYGLGYVYLGKRKTFGATLFLANLAFYAAFGYLLLNPRITLDFTYETANGVGFGIIALVFAYDAYQLGKEPPFH
jgi:hypothetical protein